MTQSLKFLAIFAPMFLFLAGVLAASNDLWGAGLFGCLGLISYLSVVRDLLKQGASRG